MLTEILTELKKQSPELECWTHGVTEESFKDDTLTINIPDKSYLQRYEKECKDKIAEIASKKTRTQDIRSITITIRNKSNSTTRSSRTDNKNRLKKI